MSSDRPTELPRAVPDAERGVSHSIVTRQERQRAEIERLKAIQGPGLLAAFFNPQMRTGMKAPRFIRRGYEANIVDELRDFYTWRPWRPSNRRSGMTRKERLKILRRWEQGGQIRRCGGGRYELVRVAPHA